eukprot:2660853-Amphidinium_carterae.1
MLLHFKYRMVCEFGSENGAVMTCRTFATPFSGGAVRTQCLKTLVVVSACWVCWLQFSDARHWFTPSNTLHHASCRINGIMGRSTYTEVGLLDQEHRRMISNSTILRHRHRHHHHHHQHQHHRHHHHNISSCVI